MSESYFQLVSPSGLRPILFASPRSNYMYIVAHTHTLARDVLYIPTDPSLFLFRFFFFFFLPRSRVAYKGSKTCEREI